MLKRHMILPIDENIRWSELRKFVEAGHDFDPDDKVEVISIGSTPGAVALFVDVDE